MNPDGRTLTLKGKDWHDPNLVDYSSMNKQVVKTIIQMNKESAKMRKSTDILEGKQILNQTKFVIRAKNSVQNEEMGER